MAKKAEAKAAVKAPKSGEEDNEEEQRNLPQRRSNPRMSRR